MFSKLFKNLGSFNGSDIAIDLGTANTLIWVKNEGIVLNEPSVIAKDTVNDSVMAVGIEAKKMLGRNPSGIIVERPLKDGVISDLDLATEMLQTFIKKINIGSFVRPRIVICIPSSCSSLEQRAVKEAAENSSAKEVYLITEPMAAAIGLGIDVSSSTGHMIVDIGGGTTEIAVIALNGVVSLRAIRMAGDKQTLSIKEWLNVNHQLQIGLKMAEHIKEKAGSAIIDRGQDRVNIEVTGKSVMDGIPKTITISKDEITKALSPSVSAISDAIRQALDQTPAEHAVDIKENGIILTGGGALLDGLDVFIRNRTNLPVFISEDPLLAIVKGTGVVIGDIKKYVNDKILIMV
ncbi:MAG: rod shape-determining protein [Candidatus Marinimicrobia bacterium]|mgnify:FL=1|nr:rod shape-determining protein [Candidatus Neomarinimicrobiota bacterium]|tara:strand:- start:1681 stop:2727 length:1047 start_codon:yes stop_codon:yes gene_type:complete